MKKFLCILLSMLMLGSFALAEDGFNTVKVTFEDGFSLDIPSDWVRYELTDDLVELGYLYCLGSADGERLMYIQRGNTNCTDIDALRTLLEGRDEIILRTEDAADSAFLTYNFANQDASGSATLLDGTILNLIFLPQSDADNMLIAATILESYEPQ